MTVRLSHSSLHRSVGPGHDGGGRPGPALPPTVAGRGVPNQQSLWQHLIALNARFEASWIGDLVGTALLMFLCWELTIIVWLIAPVQP